MADVSAAGDRKLRVFISYSRKDEDFAQELLAGLEVVGFEPYLDKHDTLVRHVAWPRIREPRPPHGGAARKAG